MLNSDYSDGHKLPETEKLSMENAEQKSNGDREAYLTTVANSIEADVMESLLRAENIPVLRKYKEAGAYLDIYMGSTSFGVDMYVPSRLLEQARELINSQPEEFQEEQQYPVNDQPEKTQGVRVGFLLLILLPVALVVICRYIFT